MVRRTRNFLKRLIRDCRAQDFVEYALLAGFVAVASTATISPIAEPIGEIFEKAQSLTKKAARTQDPYRDHPPSEPTAN
jgi:Flp pilus assembly pilin Flp